METITLEVGESPRVRVTSVGGDLRIVGRGGSLLEAQAPSREHLTVSREAEQIVVASRFGCLLFLPAGAQLEIGAVGGDARLSGITGKASLATVGGDVNLRSGGAARLGRLAGDLRVVGGRGALTAEWVGGDARVEKRCNFRLTQADLTQHRFGRITQRGRGPALARYVVTQPDG